MSDATRRGFLAMAGSGAVVVATPDAVAAPPTAAGHDWHGPLVAYAADVAGSELSIMVGEHEVVVRDPDLLARLVHAAKSAGRD